MRYIQPVTTSTSSATRTGRSVTGSGPGCSSPVRKASASPTSNQQALAKAERENWHRQWGPRQLKLGL